MSGATQYVLGRGAAIAISTNGTTFITIAGAKTASFTGGKDDMEDISNLGSPSSYREYAPTLLDAGQVAISAVFNPTDPGQQELAAAFNAQTLLQCKLTLVPMAGMTGSLVRTFSGYVTESNLDVTFDKTVSLNSTIKITGPITDTDPTS